MSQRHHRATSDTNSVIHQRKCTSYACCCSQFSIHNIAVTGLNIL